MTSNHPSAAPGNRIMWLQWIGGTGAMLLLLVPGLMVGWTSPYIARLIAKDSPIPITVHEASWVASLLTLGRLLGAIPGAVCMNYLGGKKTLIIIGFPFIVTWICLVMADSVVWLYAARLICGIGMGMAFSSFPLFLGEISSTGIRGTLVALASSGLPVGSIGGNALGAYVSLPVFGYVGFVPTIIAILIFMWLPESPHYLVRRDKMEDAKIAIARYSPGVNVEAVTKSLKDFINASDSMTLADQLREFNIPANKKAGIIIIILFMFMQFSGVNDVVFYMETILIKGGWTMTLPSTMVIVACITRTLSGFFVVYLADKYGRKALLIVSSAGVAAAMLAVGAHFTLLESGFDPVQLQWLLITSLLSFGVFLYTGLCSIPSVVLSELFAPNIKSIAACLASTSLGLFAFVATKSYQPLLDLVGMNYVFWLHAVLMMLNLIFVLQILPETKGKSLQEIQDMLHNKYEAVSKHDHKSDEN